jgi:phosphatidylinositol mannoside-binding LppM-like protein
VLPGPRQRRFTAAALLAVLAVLSLSGCVRVQVGLSVSQDDLVSGTVIIAALSSRQGDEGPKLTIPPELVGRVQTERYAADGYIGQRLTFADLQFSDVAALSESITTGKQYRMSLRRSGDLVSMSGSIDLTQLPVEGAEVQIKTAFPGTINRTNGLIEDGGVGWTPKPGAVTEFNVVAQYTDTSGVSWTKWVMIVGASAVGVALIVLVLALFTHRRSLAAERAQGQPR